MASAAGILSDHSGDVMNQLNDLFGEIVSRCGFAGKQIRSRLCWNDTVFGQAKVFINNVKHIQELPLVFMNSLDVDVEQCVSINRFPHRPANPTYKSFFQLFYRQKSFLKCRVCSQWLQIAEPVETGDPAVADRFGNE